ncbi:Serine/threonine protein kinase [Prosthecobacter debontii]|uniref:Serine/threonine protein kinase n=1 Tax=Prosthecobacter debontii TaxID=48467 RepID=A0A1T4YHP9_9BACT|nr:serine/threonine-protein kinase [Prosthecobacter debontii]SKB01233.1 Serine/threonine protein kinase [Prosthecobacter debontii]
MSPGPSDLDDDEVPSFQAIIENSLNEENLPTASWYGPEMLPRAVVMQHLPHYERWEFLGAGGMGIVYKAWHRELMRWAAIKFLIPRQASSPRALARFQNEAAVLARLHHANIVPVHDFGSEGDVAWLVMEYVDGIPLALWAKQAVRKPIETAQMLAKIARAVGVAHAAGIVHRDLKPGNILVVDNEPVLLDFGLAQHAAWQHDTRLTEAGELAGTVAYLAPEQVDPTLGEPSPATDVHACGVMLFELLAGRLPRSGLASQIITRLHEDKQPPRLGSAVKSVRKELDAICWRSMQRIPEDRYANGTSLAEDLERFLDGRPVRARNPDWLETAYLTVRRYPWLIAAASVALFAMVIAVWSIRRMEWSKERASLLSEIHHQLASPDWTSERLALTEKNLSKMKTLDTVFGRYLTESLINRTHAEVVRLMDEPRLSEQERDQVGEFIAVLKSKKYPEAEALAQDWAARDLAWETIGSFNAISGQGMAPNVLRRGGWKMLSDGIHAVPKSSGQTWSSLLGVQKVEGAIEIEVEFGPHWQQSKACGINLLIPALKDVRFFVYQAERFANLLPTFENPQKEMVMAISVEDAPVTYMLLPPEVQKSSHLVMRGRYENGDMQMSLNGGDLLHFTSVFDLARPLTNTSFSIVLPSETSLHRVELRRRNMTVPASPFAKADDLVSAGHPEEAIKIYEKYLNRASVQTECRFKYAACLDSLGRPVDAIQVWQQVAEESQEPWKSFAMYELWRCQLSQGDMESANAWFDLLMATRLPQIVAMGIPTAERLLLNQHYLPFTRSLNCLRLLPNQIEDIDRAVRVQKFLGADDREIAVRVAMAFHFAERDNQARQYFSRAISAIRPSTVLPQAEAELTLSCLDQWASVGASDGDEIFQVSLKAWLEAVRGRPVPYRAIPQLEDLRRRLRRGVVLKPPHLELLNGLISAPDVLARHRIEACLMAGEIEKDPVRQQAVWKQAAELLQLKEVVQDYSQQKLHVEFVARSLARGWTPNQTIEWMAAVLGKTRPLVQKERWAGPLIGSLSGEEFARAFNRVLHTERGRQFAHDYILRSRLARDLAKEAFQMVLVAIFSEGTGERIEDPLVTKNAELLVRAFCNHQLSEVSLMQFHILWSGIKTPATWDVLIENLDPGFKESLAALLAKRYQKLGKSEESAEFTRLSEKEKPAPKTTQVSQ